MIEETQEISQEKSTTENTITILIMRLNLSLSELDASIRFPTTSKPHHRNLYRSVYCDIFELSSLTRASLSKKLLQELKLWRNSFNEANFLTDAILFTESIYDELSESGMIDIRARKTSTFPISYYTSKLEQL